MHLHSAREGSALSETKPEEWSKLDRVRYLLDRWQDIFDPSVTSTWATFTGTDKPRSGSQPPGRLPNMAFDRSVRKIERALTTLADRDPVPARHLKAARCNVEWRTTDRWVSRRLPSGKHEVVEIRVREKLVPHWVQNSKVEQAEILLLRLLPGDISIPQDLWHALTKP